MPIKKFLRVLMIAIPLVGLTGVMLLPRMASAECLTQPDGSVVDSGYGNPCPPWEIHGPTTGTGGGSTGGGSTGGTTSPWNSPTDVVNFFNNVAFWIGNIFWMIAVISGFYAAYLYIYKGGTDDVSKAHRQLFYTVIAIAVGLMVYGLPTLIGNILKGS